MIGKLLGHSQPQTTARYSAYLLQLTRQWSKCSIRHFGGPWWIEEAKEGIHGGMSGSPIVTEDGTAVGVVAASASSSEDVHTGGGPTPRLMANLRGWLVIASTISGLLCSASGAQR